MIPQEEILYRGDGPIVISNRSQYIAYCISTEKEMPFKCRLCTRTFELDQLEMDHIIPVAIGGENFLYNVQWLCIGCHRSKTQSDNMISSMFRKLREKYMNETYELQDLRKRCVEAEQIIRGFVSSRREQIQSLDRSDRFLSNPRKW